MPPVPLNSPLLRTCGPCCRHTWASLQLARQQEMIKQVGRMWALCVDICRRSTPQLRSVQAGAPAAVPSPSLICSWTHHSLYLHRFFDFWLQAQEGDDKLGRQLRGADGTTAHLVESARAQVGS